MTTRLDSVCRVLGYGLDDHVSWFCVNSIGVRTGLPRFLVSVCTVLGHGLDDHISW